MNPYNILIIFILKKFSLLFFILLNAEQLLIRSDILLEGY